MRPTTKDETTVELDDLLTEERAFSISISKYSVGHRELYLDVVENSLAVGTLKLTFVVSIDAPVAIESCLLRIGACQSGHCDGGDVDEYDALETLELWDAGGIRYTIVFGGFIGVVPKPIPNNDPLWDGGPALGDV